MWTIWRYRLWMCLNNKHDFRINLHICALVEYSQGKNSLISILQRNVSEMVTNFRTIKCIFMQISLFRRCHYSLIRSNGTISNMNGMSGAFCIHASKCFVFSLFFIFNFDYFPWSNFVQVDNFKIAWNFVSSIIFIAFIYCRWILSASNMSPTISI